MSERKEKGDEGIIIWRSKGTVRKELREEERKREGKVRIGLLCSVVGKSQ